ncbi:MAG: pyridoxal phosphate-dependent aminotransferase [Nitrospirota bacterium]|jgi:aspartate aminotransferase
MLSERVKSIKPSPTLAMDARAKEMKARGVDVVNFGVGEPDFDTPGNIKEAAIRAIRAGETKYTPVGGILPLKDAVIEKLRKDNGLSYSREEVMVSCGAKHTLYNIAQALLDPGDEVIIPAPYWVSYPDQALLAGATPVIVRTEESEGFMLRAEDLEAAVSPRTKALVLNSPSNPTGACYTRERLEEIARVVARHDVMVISDEIYEKLLYDGAEHVSLASLGGEAREKTIVVNGVSKSYAMTGWRIGYAAGPAPVIKAMTNIQSQSTSNPASIAQWAALEALTGPQDSVEEMRREFDARRRYLVQALNAVRGITCLSPGGAFYVFPNTSALYGGRVKGSLELAAYLLEEAGVALVPGEAFGDDNFVRISYATAMEDIKRAVQRIGAAVAKL